MDTVFCYCSCADQALPGTLRINRAFKRVHQPNEFPRLARHAVPSGDPFPLAPYLVGTRLRYFIDLLERAHRLVALRSDSGLRSISGNALLRGSLIWRPIRARPDGSQCNESEKQDGFV